VSAAAFIKVCFMLPLSRKYEQAYQSSLLLELLFVPSIGA
jgi:hypothetical protein